MMVDGDIVVVAGQQYPADAIPDNVDASAAVPLDQWRRDNAVGVPAPKPAPKATKKKAADTGGDT